MRRASARLPGSVICKKVTTPEVDSVMRRLERLSPNWRSPRPSRRQRSASGRSLSRPCDWMPSRGWRARRPVRRQADQPTCRPPARGGDLPLANPSASARRAPALCTSHLRCEGKFVNLCTAVVVACGLAEDGIAKAILPVVRKLRADRARRRRGLTSCPSFNTWRERAAQKPA